MAAEIAEQPEVLARQLEGGHVPVRSPDEDSLAPLTDIVPLQRRALGMAVDRRLDPETPRGLHKVTLTR
jgi:glutamine---fructose-6-phosphate transaminase (isomerizing)